MALSSQSRRAGSGRSYRASRRRGGRRWRWLVLALLLAGGGYYLFSGGDDEPATEPDERRAAADEPGTNEDGAEGRERVAVNEESSRGDQPGGGLARQAAPPRVSDMAPVRSVNATAGREAEADSDAEAEREPEREAEPAPQRERRASREPEREGSSSGGSSTDGSGIESAEIREGMDLLADGKLVEGRAMLSALLFDDRRRLSDSDARAIRETLASVNERLVFSPEVAGRDPLAEAYEVQSGDLLVHIARRYKLTYPFLEHINRIDANRLQVGQSIKLIRGPFHARVSKRDYRMDVFLRQADGSPIYVRSFPVGLGEDDSTPEGLWVIQPNRKVTNPDWRNPRTGDYYEADDPENPIGDYWLALEGIDANTAEQRGYGIHGTIDPDSVGQSVSMGCIRLRDDDIELLYHMLVEGESTVEVVR